MLEKEAEKEVPEAVVPSDPGAATAALAGGLFRRKKASANLRKRRDAEGDATGSDDDDGSGVVRKTKQAKGGDGRLAFTTAKAEQAPLVVEYEGSKALQEGRDNLAFRSLETETEYDRDARAQREKVLKQATDGATDDGSYKGMNAYIDYRKGFRREHTVGAEKGTGSHGPLRGNAYVRVTARFDYQPDVCKDYKETGYCSYGDTCKFMHDRGDYKSGWELDRMWEEEQKRKAEALAKGWDPDAEEGDDEAAAGAGRDEDLPFACYICREPWEACKGPPVVTKCRHYFCEKCALKHNAKTSKCAVCNQATQGIFNVAQDIVKRQKRLQQQQQQ